MAASCSQSSEEIKCEPRAGRLIGSLAPSLFGVPSAPEACAVSLRFWIPLQRLPITLTGGMSCVPIALRYFLRASNACKEAKRRTFRELQCVASLAWLLYRHQPSTPTTPTLLELQ